MKELFINYYGLYNNNYKGFAYINELAKFEDTFEYGINIVQYKSNESIKYVYRSKYPNKLQKYINLYEYHFSYITDIDKLAKMYICSNCATKFRDNDKLTQHNNICKSGTVNTFEYEDKILIHLIHQSQKFMLSNIFLLR